MQNTTTVAAAISDAVMARSNCMKNGNKEWQSRWEQRLSQLQDCLPSGSGVDLGTKIGWHVAKASSNLVFQMDFHHMTGDGVYDGWTEHMVYVTATFGKSFDMRCTGRDRNNIKDHLCEMLATALRAEAPPYPWDKSEAL